MSQLFLIEYRYTAKTFKKTLKLNQKYLNICNTLLNKSLTEYINRKNTYFAFIVIYNVNTNKSIANKLVTP